MSAQTRIDETELTIVDISSSWAWPDIAHPVRIKLQIAMSVMKGGSSLSKLTLMRAQRFASTSGCVNY
jgi:hypothetical protein